MKIKLKNSKIFEIQDCYRGGSINAIIFYHQPCYTIKFINFPERELSSGMNFTYHLMCSIHSNGQAIFKNSKLYGFP